MFNREIDCPIDVMVGPSPNTNQIECPFHYVRWVQTAMMSAFEFTHEQLGLSEIRKKVAMIDI